MSGTRIGPPAPATASAGTGTPRRPSSQDVPQDLGAALGDLARLLVQDTEATRIARAQTQMEALMYAAKLASARGDVQGLRGVSSEASRIARGLGAAGIVSDHAVAIVNQAQQICGLCDGGDAQPGTPPPATDIEA